MFIYFISFSDGSIINPEDVAVFTMPDRKWHWRARTSAL